MRKRLHGEQYASDTGYARFKEEYNATAKKCKTCHTPLPYEKRAYSFCSHHCHDTHRRTLPITTRTIIDTSIQGEYRDIINTHLDNPTKEYVDALIHGYKGVMSSTKFWKLNKKTLPNKGRNRPLYYILNEHGVKYCGHCDTIKIKKEFNLNASNYTGKQTYCKKCQYETTAPGQTAVMANRRAALLNRTPAWADLEEIKEIYVNCPDGYHVDHIIPLQGKNVSGFHVAENLQYLTPFENLSKGNKF